MPSIALPPPESVVVRVAFTAEHRRAAYLEAARRHIAEKLRAAALHGAPMLLTSVTLPDPDVEMAKDYDVHYLVDESTGGNVQLTYVGWRRIKEATPGAFHETPNDDALATRTALEQTLRMRAALILLGFE